MQAPALRPSDNPRLRFAYPKCSQPASALRLSKVLATRVYTSPIRTARRTRLHFAQPTCAHPASALRLSKVRAARACTFLSEVPPNQRPHFAYPKCPQNAPALSYPKCSQNAPALRASDVRAPRVCISPLEQQASALRVSEFAASQRLRFASRTARISTSPVQSARNPHLHFSSPATRGLHFAPPKCPQSVRALRLSSCMRLQSAYPKCLQPARALLLARKPTSALRPSEVPATGDCAAS